MLRFLALVERFYKRLLFKTISVVVKKTTMTFPNIPSFSKRRIIFIILLFSAIHFTNAQRKIYSYAGNNKLYELDLANCLSREIGRVTYVQQNPNGGSTSIPFSDIAVTPNGRIFGVVNGRMIFELDSTNAQIINSWTNTQGYTYAAALLAMDNDHLITVATSPSGGRNIVSISLLTGELTIIGSTQGYIPYGDLTWLNGDLYMSNGNNHMIRFHLSDDLTSIVSITDLGLMETPYKISHGLTTFRIGECGIDSSVIYSFDGYGIYAVDPTTAATRLVCDNITDGYGNRGAAASDEALNRFREDSLLCPPLPPEPEPEPIDSSVQEPTEEKEDRVHMMIPNLFTPNGDGYNDSFYCIAEGFLKIKMLIYNRWGDLVYEEASENPSWNGKTPLGSLHSPGVYYYQISTFLRDGKENTYKGWVQLLE